MERGGVMEYIGESSAIYYWRALGLIVSVLILYVVLKCRRKDEPSFFGKYTFLHCASAQTACRQSELFQQH